MNKIQFMVKLCEQVATDVENDAKEFSGKPFDKETVVKYFNNQSAAIKALADVLKHLLEHPNH